VRKFTNDWFQQTAETNFVNNLLPRKAQFKKAIEIGCYEGQATCWMLDHMAFDHIACIDTWEGGAEHTGVNMKAVWGRFVHNTNYGQGETVQAWIDTSVRALAASVNDKDVCRYDFIYVDGSHLAKDVLTDAVLAWQILEPGGYLAFDDYTWTEKPRQEANPLDNPRLAIDAFYTIFRREAVILPSTQHQFWLMKV
jgi:predicted O-methyltransferase YrrM